MISIAYRVIVLIILVLTLWNLYDEKSIKEQVNIFLALIPLILRFLMIK